MAGSSRSRQAWRDHRRTLERRLTVDRRQTGISGERKLLPLASGTVQWLIRTVVRLSGLQGRGRRNALAVRREDLELYFPDLPAAFDGYSILHLSDLHVGLMPGGEAAIVRAIRGIRPDLVVLTGDIQTHGQPEPGLAVRLLAPILSACDAADGTLAVLGNHDVADLAAGLEAGGVRVLINEALALHRGDATLQVVGLDDVYSFFSPAATAALTACRDGFRILLAHTPELATLADEAGYRLYLCGHTHGGQICLPGGRILINVLSSHRHLARGFWRLTGLQGYTSRGAGSSSPGVRYNCPPEVTLIRLRRS